VSEFVRIHALVILKVKGWQMSILAIDAGTTGVTALVVDEAGVVQARGYQEFEQHFPQPGWVEHDPEQIWQAVLASSKQALAGTALMPTCIGITNQRETAVLWNRADLSAPRNAIVWQDRRTAEVLKPIIASGRADQIYATTGLTVDPYFTASKWLWVAQHEPAIWQDVLASKVALGTIDSYLVARLTDGRTHITDASNASRTQLMNLKTIQWDNELLDIFQIPRAALPSIVPNYGELAQTDPGAFLGLDLPITAMVGDQQSALFGQLGFEVGDGKCTYGTGAFILANTGADVVYSQHGLLSTVGWQHPDGSVVYALEGSAFVAGAAVQWLRDGMRIIDSAAETFDVARSVTDAGGVYFVPAHTGLGAPFWDSAARASFFGITRGTTRAHLVRATLESIAFEVRAVFDALAEDTPRPLQQLRVDGGAAANDLLLQMQADTLGVEVRRNHNLESTGLGAALLAGIGAGIWGSIDELKQLVRPDRVFEPGAGSIGSYDHWLAAVAATRSFAAATSPK
jgi:glycerol kinase